MGRLWLFGLAALAAGLAVLWANANEIWHASYMGDAARVRELLDSGDGGPVDARDAFGNEPLHWAAKGQSAPVVALLLARGADADARNNAGSAPLHWAVYGNDSAPVVAALVDAGASVDARNADGETPLHWAAHWNNPGSAAALIARGADATAADVHGSTPLHRVPVTCAACDRCTELVTALVAAGADIEAVDGDGRASLEHVMRHSSRAVAAAADGDGVGVGGGEVTAEEIDEAMRQLQEEVGWSGA